MKQTLALAAMLVLGGLNFATQARAADAPSCCQPKAACCAPAASCCTPKKADKAATAQKCTMPVQTGNACCAPGAACCTPGAACCAH